MGKRAGAEAELQAMEQELERQLQEYRQAAASTPPGAAANGRTASAAVSLAATGGLGEAGWSTSAAKRLGGTMSTAQLESEEVPGELRDLRAAAAEMESFFPAAAEEADSAEAAAPSASGEASEPGEACVGDKAGDRVKAIARRGREGDRGTREEGPPDPEVVELRSVLDDLDVRLRAIHSREAMHTAELQHRQQQAEAATAASHSRAVAEMQAQNDHLRACFAATGGKGLLCLDRGVFGAPSVAATSASDGCKTPSSTPALSAPAPDGAGLCDTG